MYKISLKHLTISDGKKILNKYACTCAHTDTHTRKMKGTAPSDIRAKELPKAKAEVV